MRRMIRRSCHLDLDADAHRPADARWMNDADMIRRLNALAHYIRQGGEVAWHEPEPRNKKGPDRRAVRHITISVANPGRLDHIAWQLMLRDMRQRR
jgi:hypothetical protein